MDFSEMSEEEIEKYIEEQVEERAENLEEKKQEILDEKKKEQKRRETLEKRVQELEEAINEKEKEKARKEENIEELEQRLEEEKEQAVQQERQEKKKLREELQKMKVDNQLTDALLEHNVDGDYMDYVKGHLKRNVDLKETDDGYEAVAERDGMEMPINDFVEEWAEEEGEKFVKARDNLGGGAGADKNGTGGGGTSNPLDRSSDDFSIDEAAQFVQKHGEDSDEVQQKLDQAADPAPIQGVNV